VEHNFPTNWATFVIEGACTQSSAVMVRCWSTRASTAIGATCCAVPTRALCHGPTSPHALWCVWAGENESRSYGACDEKCRALFVCTLELTTL